MEVVIKSYLHALGLGSYPDVLSLFSENAKIISPLYGIQPASVFYKELLADTNSSRIELLDIFTNTKKRRGAVNFIYHWTMANGTITSFDCVDIIEFDEQNKITQLKIIYDTVQARIAFEQQKQG